MKCFKIYLFFFVILGVTVFSAFVNESTADWGEAQRIDRDKRNITVRNPQIAVDMNGNAVVVWERWTGGHSTINANNYVVGKGWGKAQLIQSDENKGWDNKFPDVVMDSKGNAIAIWCEPAWPNYNIYANRYVAKDGWAKSQLIATGAGNVCDDTNSNTQIAMDSNGNAIVVWAVWSGSASRIYTNRYIAGQGWGKAERIQTDESVNAMSPYLAIDSKGNAILVWRQFDKTKHYRIYASHYNLDKGWSEARIIQTVDGRDATVPNIVIDSKGNAIAVWKQFGAKFKWMIYTNFYKVGEGWGNAQPINTSSGEIIIHGPRIAIDTRGNAIVMWTQETRKGASFFAIRYTTDKGWDKAMPIDADKGIIRDLQIAMDHKGNAIAFWAQEGNSGKSVWLNQYELRKGWGAPQTMQTANAEGSDNPRVAIDPKGNAIAVWAQWGKTTGIWARQYISDNGFQKDAGFSDKKESDDEEEFIIVKGKGIEICELYQKNLNSFAPLHPSYLICERNFKPEFKEFSQPQWEEIDILENKELLKKIEDFVGEHRSNNPEEWIKEVKWDIENRHTVMKQTKVDIDNDGKKENVIKYYRGICGGTRFYGSSIVVVNNERKTIDPKKIPLGPENEPVGIGYWMYDIFNYKGKVYFDKGYHEFKNDKFTYFVDIFITENNKTHKICKYRSKFDE